jgi:transcription initiation factor TFIID subunit 2
MLQRVFLRRAGTVEILVSLLTLSICLQANSSHPRPPAIQQPATAAMVEPSLGPSGAERSQPRSMSLGSASDENAQPVKNGVHPNALKGPRGAVAALDKAQKPTAAAATAPTAAAAAAAAAPRAAPNLKPASAPKPMPKPAASKPTPAAAAAAAGGPNRGRKSGGSLHDQLRRLLDEVSASDKFSTFKAPVTRKVAPDYYDIVKEPMDFKTMRTKLEKHQYQDVLTFKRVRRLCPSRMRTRFNALTVLQ